MEKKIDFVIPWVDGNDEAWICEKKKYQVSQQEDASVNRYRDWSNLQFWFRGVEKYAPWVNKIHFITWGHVPEWLNEEHPKLHIVKHEDYIHKKYLPAKVEAHLLNVLQSLAGTKQTVVINYFNDDVGYYEEFRDQVSVVRPERGRVFFNHHSAIALANIKQVRQ